jgi:hypothetical protein
MTPPNPRAHPTDLAGLEVPEVHVPDADVPWLALTAGHKDENGAVDTAALVVRLQGLALAALDMAQRLAGSGGLRPDRDARWAKVAESLVDAAAKSLGAHEARRVATYRKSVAAARWAERLLAAASGLAGASGRAGRRDARGRSSGAGRPGGGGPTAGVGAVTGGPGDLRATLQRAGRRRRRGQMFVCRKSGLTSRGLRAGEEALARLRAEGLGDGAPPRLVVEPELAGPPRGRQGRPPGRKRVSKVIKAP